MTACPVCGVENAPSALTCKDCSAHLHQLVLDDHAPRSVAAPAELPNGSAGSLLGSLLALISFPLNPGKFFKSRMPLTRPALSMPLVWMVGTALGLQLLSPFAAFPGRSGEQGPAATTFAMLNAGWTGYWEACLAVGIILGGVRWYLAGWWYIYRIEKAGGAKVDAHFARLMLIHTDLLWAVPTIAVCVLKCAVASNYHATTGSSWLWLMVGENMLVIPAAGMWSIWTSARGVDVNFKTSALGNTVWFVVLPLLSLASCTAFDFVVHLTASFAEVAPP